MPARRLTCTDEEIAVSLQVNTFMFGVRDLGRARKFYGWVLRVLR
jgi:hypothetical protein